MDNNLNEQTPDQNTSTGTAGTPSSYEDPNAGYRDESAGKDPNQYVPKEPVNDTKEPESEQTSYSYGESTQQKEQTGQNGYGQSYGGNQNNQQQSYGYQNQNGAYGNYGSNDYQNGTYNSGYNQNSYNGAYGGQNPYQAPQGQMDQSPLSMGEWILTLIVGMVPCVGLIIFLIWAFGSNGNVNRRNYCRAALIIQIISLIVVIAFVLVVGIGIGASGYYYY